MAEKVEWDALRADRAKAERRLKAAQAQPKRNPHDAALHAELEAAQKAIEDIDAELALFERIVTGGSDT